MRTTTLAVILFTAGTLAGCGGGGDGEEAAPSTEPAATAQPTVGADLTDEELEQGIGPVKNLVLADIDPVLAAEGESQYTLLCSACHKFPERYIGPELGTVLSRRRPEFVMNMMLNANEMMQRHPVVRELLAEYIAPMAQQSVSPEQARAILEYIRTQQS
ncbi:MAG: c-type cytochrome [Longimicrobiales bacterium]